MTKKVNKDKKRLVLIMGKQSMGYYLCKNLYYVFK